MGFHETVITLANDYISEAIALLNRDTLDEEAVHDIRVLMKRLRGLLRLYRDAGCKAEVAQLNPVLRDVARTFAAQRDSHVLADTLRAMAVRANRSVARQLRAILRELEQQTAAAAPELSPGQLAADLVWVRSFWHEHLTSVNEKALLDALTGLYHRNRRQGREALRLRDKTVLHDWRKRVKYLYYQLCALPGFLKGERCDDIEALRRLGSLLGKIHDLDVLADYLDEEGHDHTGISRMVFKRRARLVKKVRRLYQRLFSRSSKEFRRLVNRELRD